MMQKLIKLLDVTALPRTLWQNRSLLFQFTRRNVESRYRGSLLGLLWSFIQPLMMLFIYTFVFSIVFKAKWNLAGDGAPGVFPVVMFSGMAMYNIFQESIILNCSVITGNQNLVKKVIFPLDILPVANMGATAVLGMAWLALLVIGVLIVFGHVCWTLVLTPLVYLPLLMITLGVSYFVASLGVYMRDMQYIVGIILQVLFFMTPVFYPIENVPEQFQPILLLNPLSPILEQGRQVMIFGQVPDVWVWLRSFAIAYLVLHFGYVWFRTTKKGFADVL